MKACKLRIHTCKILDTFHTIRNSSKRGAAKFPSTRMSKQSPPFLHFSSATFRQMPTKGNVDFIAKLASASAAIVVRKVKLTSNYALPDYL